MHLYDGIIIGLALLSGYLDVRLLEFGPAGLPRCLLALLPGLVALLLPQLGLNVPFLLSSAAPLVLGRLLFGPMSLSNRIFRACMDISRCFF